VKVNRGSFVWFVLLLSLPLLAQSPYSWSVKASKDRVYMHEAVHLSYECRFSGEADQYAIEFKPFKEGADYRIEVLKEEGRYDGDKWISRFEYVLFPKREGALELSLDATMFKTNKESIENAIIGRDNVEDDYFVSGTSVKLPSVSVEVLPQPQPYAGMFTLRVQPSKPRVEAYEPVQVRVTLEGNGNIEVMEPFELDIEGTTRFSEAPLYDFRLTPRGFEGALIQHLAFSAEENFTIPSLEFTYFDLQSRTTKVLKTASYPIEVVQVHTPESLLDAQVHESAPLFKWEWTYLNYLMTFLLGMAVGGYLFRRRHRKKELLRHHSLVELIENARDKKALLLLLASSGMPCFDKMIAQAEQRQSSLGTLKKEALAEL